MIHYLPGLLLGGPHLDARPTRATARQQQPVTGLWAILQAYSQLHTLRDPLAFPRWLHQIAHNVLLNFIGQVEQLHNLRNPSPTQTTAPGNLGYYTYHTKANVL